jgi:hypothetical protein
MKKVGFKLAVHGANARSSGVTVGFQGTKSWHLYVRGVFFSYFGASVDVASIAVASRIFRLDDKMVRSATRLMKMHEVATNDLSMDRFAVNMEAVVVANIDTDREIEIRDLYETVLACPCFGGKVVPRMIGETKVVMDPLEEEFFAGSRLLLDCTDEIMGEVNRHNIPRAQAMYSVMNRTEIPGLTDPHLVRFMNDRGGYVVPCPIGYRLLEAPVKRPGHLRGCAKHAFAEPIIGFAEYVSPFSLKDGFSSAYWEPCEDEEYFYMRGRKGYSSYF